MKDKTLIIDTPVTRAILLQYEDGQYFPILFPSESKAMKMHRHSTRKNEEIRLYNVFLTGLRVNFMEINDYE